MRKRFSRTKLTSNGVIAILLGKGQFIVKTMTRKGVVYSFNHDMRIVPNEVAERLIDKGTLIPREPSEQTFVLSREWGDPQPASTWGTFS